jgi:hypothetical protein
VQTEKDIREGIDDGADDEQDASVAFVKELSDGKTHGELQP